jgi:hypothetical protein
MKWYFVSLLFAQSQKKEKRFVMCETCNVLFRAESALEAYDKSVVWAKDYEKDSNFHFVGVEHLVDVRSKKIVDGTEIDGSFFKIKDVWKRKKELIPNKYEINTIKCEVNPNTPIGELMGRNGNEKWIKFLIANF